MISRIKKIQKHTLIALLFVLILPLTDGFAQDVKKVGTAAAPFLRIPVGARGAALGGAFVAQAEDATAMFWNPAGLARMDNFALMVDHSNWLPGIDFDYFAAIVPMAQFGTIGFNVTSLGADDMILTTVEDPDGIEEATFSAGSIAFGVTYARNLTDRFAIGANFKFAQERIYNSSAHSFMFDVGTLYTTPFDGIRFGVNISNFGTPLRMDGDDLNIRVDIAPNQEGNNQSVVGRLMTDSFETPLIMRVGLAWDAMTNEAGRLTILADGINPNDNAQSLNFGAEFGMMNDLLMLRGGYNELYLDQTSRDDAEKGMTLGAGLKWKLQNGVGFAADYAYQDFANLSDVNRFTVTVLF